jgi:serine/threonine-protein kinase
LVLLLGAGFLLLRNLGYLGGAASFNLPSVVGQQATVATATLRADGLDVTIQQQVSDKPPGSVLSTNPPPNALVKKGDMITMKVAEPAPVQQILVPPGLTGTTVANAEAILQSAGLQYSVAYRTSTAQKGTVLSTNPTSGTKINVGGTVALTVSSGPANVLVPSLAGLSQAQAGQVLGNAGLNVGAVSSQSSTQYGAGLVISSNPATGQSVAPGSAVDIVVSTGTPATTTTSTTTTTTLPPTTTTTSTTPATTTTTKAP